MIKEINILFLGGARRYSLAERFIIAGKTLNIQVNIYSYELTQDVPITGIAKKIIIGKRWNDENIFEDLKTIVEQYKINILLPFVDPAIEILAKLKSIINKTDVCIPVSDVETCKIFFDKILAQEWFLKHQFPVPIASSTFPIIAKPRKGSAGKGIQIIHNDIELHQFKQAHNLNDFLIQQFIDAEEYTVDSYVSIHSKEILGIVPRQRIEILGGEVIKSITKKEQKIIELTKIILTKGNFCGPITIQFLKDIKSNMIYIMEINPRFGGGVINSIEAGFDIPLILLKEYLNLPVSPINHFKENLLMLRTFREVFICK